MQEKPDYDQPLKAMFEADPAGVLELLGQQVTWLQSLSPELPSGMRRADLAWKVERPTGQQAILHLELQTKIEDDLGGRLAEYSLRLWLRDKLPVRSVVIFFRPGGVLPTSPFDWSWSEEAGRGYPFDVVRLWEVQPERILRTAHYALWPLAGVMGKQVTSETFEGVAERIIHVPLPRPQIASLIGWLAGIGGLRLSKESLTEVVRRNPMMEDLLRESSFVDVVADLLRPEIKAEGRAEGMREMAHRMVQRALESKFGALSDDLLAALNTADQETLEDIVSHISADTLEQARARLKLS